MSREKWILPEGIEEFLPNEAAALEVLRGKLLSHFKSWGYELVIPPLVEYLESLLTGTGNDLDIQTFKLVDQNNGRTMGVRADMTPQVARIDAHRVARDNVTRLCYIGTVLQTRPDDFTKARSITQVGAEIYGHRGDHSDIEILHLLLSALKQLGIPGLHLDLGHVGVFSNLIKSYDIDKNLEIQLFDVLQRKSAHEIESLMRQHGRGDDEIQIFKTLCALHGGVEVLAEAQQKLANANADVLAAIQSMQVIADDIQAGFPDVTIHCDLSELRGYQYHTGCVFAVYNIDHSQAIAKGGRYDNIGAAFGRARAATGFSADLRILLRLSSVAGENGEKILAPWHNDKKLRKKIDALRAQNKIVINQLPGSQDGAEQLGCNAKLVKSASGDWEVIALR